VERYLAEQVPDEDADDDVDEEEDGDDAIDDEEDEKPR